VQRCGKAGRRGGGAAYRGAADGEARRILALGDRDAKDLLTNLQPRQLGGHPLLVLGGARVEELDEQLDLRLGEIAGEIEGGWGRVGEGGGGLKSV